tara:strand:+ start:1294 stop:1440 length:147 start_codon:yes stop_codon:yes gene_type:complete
MEEYSGWSAVFPAVIIIFVLIAVTIPELLPGIEPGFVESKSTVLTTTP